MSSADPRPPETPVTQPEATTPPRSPEPKQPDRKPSNKPGNKPGNQREKDPDPLRGSRTSGYWVAVLVLAVVLLLLAIFILQNTAKVKISYLGWDGHAPLAAALLIAAVAGALLVASAGALRILQLRRRIRRERKR